MFWTMSTVLNIFFSCALPYFAKTAPLVYAWTVAYASIAVYVFRLRLFLISFGKHFSHSFSSVVVVLLSNYKDGTFRTDYSAVTHNFVQRHLTITTIQSSQFKDFQEKNPSLAP